MVLLKMMIIFFRLKAMRKLLLSVKWQRLRVIRAQAHLLLIPTKLDNAYDSLIELGADVTYAQGYYKAPPTKKDKNRTSESES